MLQIQLDWKGPFGLATPEERDKFDPREEPGVYLWTVVCQSDHLISYVGQAKNLRDRMYQHLFSTLGGAYCLYGDDHLTMGKKPDPEYKPDLSNLLRGFLKEYLNKFDTRSKLALKNLFAYRFFWAVVDEEREIREAVESALFDEAKKQGEPVQNTGRSRGPQKSRRMLISSTLPDNVRIPGLKTEIYYGSIE